ncbi:MAG: hypothetical protein V1899_10790 [Planctomycetota bacterium]
MSHGFVFLAGDGCADKRAIDFNRYVFPHYYISHSIFIAHRIHKLESRNGQEIEV